MHCVKYNFDQGMTLCISTLVWHIAVVALNSKPSKLLLLCQNIWLMRVWQHLTEPRLSLQFVLKNE